MKRTVLIASIILFTTVAIALLIHFSNKGQEKSLIHPINTHDLDAKLGKVDATDTLFVYFTFNCGHCQAFLRDIYLSEDHSWLTDLNLMIVLKPFSLSNNANELQAIQAFLCTNKVSDAAPLVELFNHNYNVIYHEKFQELLDIYTTENTALAECLIDNNDYTRIKGNYIDFLTNNFLATPTFVINNQYFVGYKNQQSLVNKIKQVQEQ